MSSNGVHIKVFFCVLLASLMMMGQRPLNEELVWPTAPDRPRIRHVMSFSGKMDLEIAPSWWQKIISFIFGSESESGTLIRPQAIAVDGQGRIFIADPGARGVHIFDIGEKEYAFLDRFGGERFLSPVGVAVTGDGACFVSDSERGVVVAFDKDGEFVFMIRSGLSRPTGIALRGDRLYITDTGNHQIVVCDLHGNVESRIGRRGVGETEFNFPVYLAASSLQEEDANTTLYVVDAMNFRIQVLTAEGLFVSDFGAQGVNSGSFANPKGIALDSEGHLFVADALLDVVQIFNQEGNLLLVFGKSGTGDGEFSLPAGICIDRDDRIYVADVMNRRIQIFEYLRDQ